MIKTRCSLLREVFNKLLVETLKPLRAENLEQMLQNFPNGTAQELSNIAYKSVEINTKDEFEQILIEKNVEERLNKLDELYASQKSSYELNMSAFEFEPHDPDRVKRSIVYEAKKQEIKRLSLILSNLEKTNNDLEAKDAEILEELSKARETIKETQEHLENLASNM